MNEYCTIMDDIGLTEKQIKCCMHFHRMNKGRIRMVVTGHQLREINEKGHGRNDSRASALKYKIDDSVKETVILGNYGVLDLRNHIKWQKFVKIVILIGSTNNKRIDKYC